MAQVEDNCAERNWREVEKFFARVLISDDYDLTSAEQLGFYTAQILEDAEPLLKAIDRINLGGDTDRESLLEQFHMLFNNYDIFTVGYRLLMRQRDASE